MTRNVQRRLVNQQLGLGIISFSPMGMPHGSFCPHSSWYLWYVHKSPGFTKSPILVEPSLGTPKILGKLHLFFKQYQWQFNVQMYNVCKEHMENQPLKNLMKSSTFYNQTVFFNSFLTFQNMNKFRACKKMNNGPPLWAIWKSSLSTPWTKSFLYQLHTM